MLTTVESLRQYLNKDDADVQDDDFLFELVKRVSARVNAKLDRVLEAADYTEYYEGDGTNKLLVRQYPINTITSVHDDVARVFGSDTLKSAGSIIIASQTPGLVVLNGDIFINAQLWQAYATENIKIVYNAGYATIPDDIEQAVNKLCACEYMDAKGTLSGIKTDRSIKSIQDEAWEDLQDYARIR